MKGFLNVFRKDSKGFSLVELMVVVAIIGILATIAIPQVTRFIAKAKQTEARTNLSQIYTNEKALFAEYNVYHERFGVIGFAPEGNLIYNVGFTADNATQPTNFPGAIWSTTITNEFSTKSYCGASGPSDANCTINGGPADLAAAYAVSGATFTAGATGVISSGGTADVWSIDHTKNLELVTSGLD